MIDEEEMEEEQEDDDLIAQQPKKALPQLPPLRKLPRPAQEVETQFAEEEPEAEEPKIQLVEREVNLSLVNEKLNFIISLLTKK